MADVPDAALPSSPVAKSSRSIEDSLVAQRKKQRTTDGPTGIPVISLAPFREGGEAGKRKVADEWDRACSEVGFVTIVDHGVPKEVIDAMWSQTIAFFDRPVEEKRAAPMTDDYPYGYQGMGMEGRARARVRVPVFFFARG